MNFNDLLIPSSLKEINFSRLFSSDIFDNITKPIMQNRYGISALHAFSATAFVVVCSFLWSRDKAAVKQDEPQPQPQQQPQPQAKTPKELQEQEEWNRTQAENTERMRKSEEEYERNRAEMAVLRKQRELEDGIRNILESKVCSEERSKQLLDNYTALAETKPDDMCFDFKLADVLLRFAQFGIGNKEIAEELIKAFYTPFEKNESGEYKAGEDDNPTTEEKVNRRMLAFLLYNSDINGRLTIACLNEDLLKSTGLPEDTRNQLMLFKEYYTSLLPTVELEDYKEEKYIQWVHNNRSAIEDEVKKEERQQALIDMLYASCIESGNFYMAIAKLDHKKYLQDEFEKLDEPYRRLFEKFVKENPDRDDALLYTPDESGKMPVRVLLENFTNINLQGQSNIVLCILTQFNDSAKGKDEKGVSTAMKQAVQLSDKEMPDDMPDVKWDYDSIRDISSMTLLEMLILSKLRHGGGYYEAAIYLLKYDPMLRVQTVKDMVSQGFFVITRVTGDCVGELMLNGRWEQVKGNKEYLLHRIVREFDLGSSRVLRGVCEALEYLALKCGYDVLQKDANGKAVSDCTLSQQIIDSLRATKDRKDLRDLQSINDSNHQDCEKLNITMKSLRNYVFISVRSNHSIRKYLDVLNLFFKKAREIGFDASNFEIKDVESLFGLNTSKSFDEKCVQDLKDAYSSVLPHGFRVLKELSDRMEMEGQFASLLICISFDNPDINAFLSSVVSGKYVTEDERKQVETALNSGAVPVNDNNNFYVTRCYEALKPHFKQPQNERQIGVSK